MSITKDQLAVVMEQTIDEIMFLRDAGQKEYAHSKDNAFRNFEAVAQDIEIPREKVLWTYFKKHLDGIKAHINGHVSQREHVGGRINDAIVYLIILKAMVLENEGYFKRTEPEQDIPTQGLVIQTEPTDRRGRRIGKRASKKQFANGTKTGRVKFTQRSKRK